MLPLQLTPGRALPLRARAAQRRDAVGGRYQVRGEARQVQTLADIDLLFSVYLLDRLIQFSY